MPSSLRVRERGWPSLVAVCAGKSMAMLPKVRRDWWVGCIKATEESAHAGIEFGEAEGFDEVVVGSGVESVHAVGDEAAGGEHEDGDGVLALADLAADGEAVEFGEHEVEEDEVGGFFEGEGEALFAVGGGDHAMSFCFEGVGEADAQGGFVFDEKDAGGGLHLGKFRVRSWGVEGWFFFQRRGTEDAELSQRSDWCVFLSFEEEERERRRD